MMRALASRMPSGTGILVRMAEITNHSLVLPLVVFFPTSRCNSACVSCDWWRAMGDGDLSLVEIRGIADSLHELGTRVVVFSGGEPLLRPEVFKAAELFRSRGVRLHLLTSGVLLERFAPQVAAHFERVVISLDAPSEALYRAIRGVAALAVVERGVARMRHIARHVPLSARATLHKRNFRELPRLIDHARAMGLDSISFLAADLGSSAFGRERSPSAADLGLSGDEVAEFEAVVDTVRVTHAADFASGFVAESPERLHRLPQYYAALNGHRPFPRVACNAPWMSVVVEADGVVRPCYFHRPIGNVRDTPLPRIVATNLSDFRRELDVGSNEMCRRCVCSIRTGWARGPWQ